MKPANETEETIVSGEFVGYVEVLRYRVVSRSQTHEWAFSHTVVDTTKRRVWLDGTPATLEETGEPLFEGVCETCDEEKAELVCAALNAYRPEGS